MGSGSSKNLSRDDSGASPSPLLPDHRPSRPETVRDEVEGTAGESMSPSCNESTTGVREINSILSEDASAGPSSGSLQSLDSVQVRKVQHCLTVLETSLELSISCEEILPYVEMLVLGASSEVLYHGGEAKGIFVVNEGALEVLSPDGGTVLNRLLPGDFCGELSTLFRVPCSAAVHCEYKVSLLRLPPSIVLEHTRGPLRREAMFQWCTRRAYIDTCSLFAARELSKAAIASCLKNSSTFSRASPEALKVLSEASTPILFSAGDKLYSSGDEAEVMFCILRGAVECSTSSQTVSNRSVKYSDEGYCIAEQEFVAGTKLSHQARALGPLLVAPIARELLAEVDRQACSLVSSSSEQFP